MEDYEQVCSVDLDGGLGEEVGFSSRSLSVQWKAPEGRSGC